MKKLLLFTILLLCFLFSGCTGYREIDRGYFVTAIAFSKNGDNTTIFIEALSSSDVIEEDSKKVLLTGSGNSVSEAYADLKNSLIKPLYFEHLGAVVFEDEGYDNIAFLKQITNIKSDVYIVKTHNMDALFKNDTSNGTVGYDVVSLIKHTEKESGKTFLNRLYNAQKSSLPYVDFTHGKLEISLQGE